jgi:hypothetical protein
MKFRGQPVSPDLRGIAPCRRRNPDIGGALGEFLIKSP